MHSVFLESHHLQNMYFGFGQYNYHLIKAMLKQADKNIQFQLHISRKNPVISELNGEFTVKPYSALRRYPIFRIRKKYDLWHSMNQNTKIEPASKIPYLLTVHNTAHIRNEKTYLQEKDHIRFQAKLNRSNSITYISNYAKESTHRYYDVPDVPEYVIYNGNPISKVDLPDGFRPTFVPKRPFFFTIGEITDRKNFASLVPVMSKIKNYDLVIAGKKNTISCQKLKEDIDRFNLRDRIFLVGKISELSKLFYYKHCDAFLFPSLREGFGLPVIEAMKFGKPTFISNNTSLPEVGGNNAFYWHNYDPDHMLEVLENGMEQYLSKPAEYANAYRSQAARFNWDKSASQYLQVYHSLMDNL